jgi:phenylacetate-coenzyme A ligase PaaK-like adenylate-forming protein
MDMKGILDNRELEEAPLDRLVESTRSSLVESRLLTRAETSAVYQRRWREARFDPDECMRLEDLHRAPFTTERDLASAGRGKDIRSYACSPVHMWFRVTGRGGAIWWMPCGKQDILKMMGLCGRMSRVVGFGDDDLALVLSQPAPAVSDGLPYFLGYAHRLNQGAKLEVMPVSLSLLQHRPKWAAFFLHRKPSVLVTTPADALQLAGILKSNSAAPAQTESRGPLDRLRLAVMFGDGVGQHRQEVTEEYGVDTFQTHGVTDCLLLNMECRMHEGVHIWLDTCIAEILPAAEPGDSRAKPRAIFLHEAKPGTSGELVVTTFAEALPLIRYRTGETVEVVSSGRCGCGISHPRVRFL